MVFGRFAAVVDVVIWPRKMRQNVQAVAKPATRGSSTKYTKISNGINSTIKCRLAVCTHLMVVLKFFEKY